MNGAGAGRRGGNGDRPGGGRAAGWLLNGQAPNFVGEIVRIVRLKHAAELAALAEGLVGLCLRTDRNRDVLRRVAAGCHDTDEQRAQID
jgi:hypothetical protein